GEVTQLNSGKQAPASPERLKTPPKKVMLTKRALRNKMLLVLSLGIGATQVGDLMPRMSESDLSSVQSRSQLMDLKARYPEVTQEEFKKSVKDALSPVVQGIKDEAVFDEVFEALFGEKEA